MDSSQKTKCRVRNKRRMRVRKNLRGTEAKPRMCVVKTNSHIHVQLINDEQAVTLASTSTLSKEFQKSEFKRKNKTSAKQLGLKIAALAKQKNVQHIVFDRGVSKYHGVIAAVADGAREGGLEF